ncbi:MAG TPA: sigma-54 dependent transcriptional regulator [Gemmataceae bacterium]|nr:sigma-54 dependent transcriptional regulator [Gemmataceae bacterium]
MEHPGYPGRASLEVIPIHSDDQVDPLGDAFGPEVQRLRDQICRVAPQDTTVLLSGETGTGKTRLARYIHEHSPRRDEPFLVVDCGALSPSLMESEIFGHVKGAFTGADRDRPGKFAAVGRGTLLLDEINSLPLTLQSRLLRGVDERLFEPVGANTPLPLHARLIAATNVPLEPEVAERRFRSDLYYRLNVVEFVLPPLRQRRPAIARLALRFLAEFAGRNRPDIQGITAEVMTALENYHWPGNIRELRNILERTITLSPGPVLGVGDLPPALRSPVASPPATPALDNGANSAAAAPRTGSLFQAREEAEIRRIKQALEKHGNNRLRAAAELGISRMGLYKKLEKYRMR